jgi:hypothetical protein
MASLPETVPAALPRSDPTEVVRLLERQAKLLGDIKRFRIAIDTFQMPADQSKDLLYLRLRQDMGMVLADKEDEYRKNETALMRLRSGGRRRKSKRRKHKKSKRRRTSRRR